MGSPVDTSTTTEAGTTVRYVAGSLSDATRDLKKDSHGVWSLGSDGVLRSFLNNLTVIDYRNLDPAQFSELHTAHLKTFYDAGMELPDVFKSLSETVVDGRLVTDLSKLLHPDETPSLLPLSEGRITTVERSIPEFSSHEKRQECGWSFCESIAECIAVYCAACFFIAGPPTGLCIP